MSDKSRNDAHYWRNAYETLVKETGRDLNDGLGLDPRKSLKLGATGNYPQGVLEAHDEGELRLAVAYDKPVAWLGLPPEQAVAIAHSLLKHAGAGGGG